VQRDTLLDFFRDLAEHSRPFLIYDDGFRTTVRTYAEAGRAARRPSARRIPISPTASRRRRAGRC